MTAKGITLSESKHAFTFVVSEDSDGAGLLSRDVATINGGMAGRTIVPGDFLGRAEDGSRVPLNPSATDGTQHFDSLAGFGVQIAPGGAADITVINAHATVREADLNWPAGITAPQRAALIAELAARLIKLR